MRDLEAACAEGEKWVLNSENHDGISNWITLGPEKIYCHNNGMCHAMLTYMYQIFKKEKPLTHSEYFAKAKSLGASAQDYYKWTCSPNGLFGAWTKGIRLIHNPKTNLIIGATLTDMDALDHGCTQWMFANRMIGEYPNRIQVWNELVQRGMPPEIAFWAAHFFMFQSGGFRPAGTGHIGINQKSAFHRLAMRKPFFKDTAKPFHELSSKNIYSNYIWMEDSPWRRSVDRYGSPIENIPPYEKNFKPMNIKSKTFGIIEVANASYEPESVFDGLRKLADEEKIDVKW